MEIPAVPGSVHLEKDIVGSHLANYDSILVLSHFKGHAMGGFGGALKNISIGIASQNGKMYIHSGGTQDERFAPGDQNAFLESMAEAAGAVMQDKEGRMVYISVMNNLSVDCDFDSSPEEPDMHDIGSDFSKNLGRKEVFRFTLTKNRLKYTTKYSIYTTKWPFWNEM